jgi:hypothetical protein
MASKNGGHFNVVIRIGSKFLYQYFEINHLEFKNAIGPHEPLIPFDLL